MEKLLLQIPEDVEQELIQLQQSKGIEAGEEISVTLRNALKWILIIDAVKKAGGRILVEDSEGEQREVIFD